MRTRKEIEKEMATGKGLSVFLGRGMMADTNSALILEIVLDIRDLLNPLNQ